MLTLRACDSGVQPDHLLARGKPEVIRFDNVPEYISAAIQTWAQEWGFRFEYNQLG